MLLQTARDPLTHARPDGLKQRNVLAALPALRFQDTAQRPRPEVVVPATTARSQAPARHAKRLPRFICRAGPTPPTKGRSVSFSIPIHYTQLLGLKGKESYFEPQILAAYEDLAGTQVEEGYSSRVQDGKLRMLDQAVDEARNSPVTRGSEVHVPWDDLPGALALLQEVGEYDLVVAMGTKLLEKWESRSFRRDILLSMALAQCGLATDTFAVQQVSAGCARMEEALVLLNDAGAPPLAPGLQQEIKDSLQEFKPKCILDHLKLPLALEHTAQRKQALHALTNLLTESGAPATVDAQYLQQALLCLTAAEVVQLLDWTSVAQTPMNASWQTIGVYEQAATAFLVRGFQERQPSQIRAAESIFQRLSKDRSAIVEQVICKVLLGQPEAALDTLALTEGPVVPSQRPPQTAPNSALSRPDSTLANSPVSLGQAIDRVPSPSKAEAAAFVSRHSPDPSDLLPGLCLLTERWLQRVAFPAFRQTDHPTSASLVEYFQDSGVETYLQSQEDESEGRLSPLHGMQAWTKNAEAFVQRIAHQVSLARQRAGSQATSHQWGTQQSSSMPLNPLAWSPAVQGLAAAGVMMTAALFWSSLRRTSLTNQRQHIPMPAAAEVSTSQRIDLVDSNARSSPYQTEQHHPINSAQAEKIVRSWQAAKTAALGPRRDLDALPDILIDPMLSRFQSEAAQAEETGWFWKYKVSSVQVHSVSAVNDDGAVTITATLREKADLYGANGKHADSYNNPYTVEYTVVEDEEQWKIIDALVLGTQSS